MSENQIIAVMAAIVHAGGIGKNGYNLGYDLDDALKAAVALYDKALTSHERYSKTVPPIPPPP